jgi:hypothetical protein
VQATAVPELMERGTEVPGGIFLKKMPRLTAPTSASLIGAALAQQWHFLATKAGMSLRGHTLDGEGGPGREQ